MLEMGELTIRRNRSFAALQYQGTGKAEKQSGSARTQRPAAPGFTVSETLRQLMTRVRQAESRSRESYRTLQAGEGALAEIQERLGRAAQLLRKSDGSSDSAALQSELDRLAQEIDRIAASAAVDDVHLFLDEGADIQDAAMLLTSAGEASGSGKGIQSLPDWLLSAVTQPFPSPEQLLAALGLTADASPSELLAAIMNRSPETSPAAGRLAALYLGAVIAGGVHASSVDMSAALEGLQLLLEKVASGVALDEAVEMLTRGMFTGISDFQDQFTGGTAPGLSQFLSQLLPDGGGAPFPEGSSLLAILAAGQEAQLELMMDLLAAVSPSALQGGQADTLSEPDGGSAAQPAAGTGQAAGGAQPAVPGAEQSPGAGSADVAAPELPPVRVIQLGKLQAAGRDLSQVSFRSTDGVLTIGAHTDVTIQGLGQALRTVRVTGPGPVILQDVNTALLSVETGSAQVLSAGKNSLGEVRLQEGAHLTLGGSGQLNIGHLPAGRSNALHFTGGIIAVAGQSGEEPGGLNLPVVVDGPVILSARAVSVSNFQGKALEPFDLVWKTLLPDWHAVTSLTVDGRQVKIPWDGSCPDPARLWLEKGNSGYTIHTLVIRGQDEFDQPQARYAYLRWNQQANAFQEVSMYPNPFAVTGGEPGRDWVYEQASHTLHILSARVTAVSGGCGTDIHQAAFSGRIALADKIGEIGLLLDGVVCRVSSGRAFHLGSRNQVTLTLQSGTQNFFESGSGCAGISIGDDTCLNICCADSSGRGKSAGTLTATGSGGGAGIGRDSDAGRAATAHISIHGGVITATGAGGGAGIGSGAHGSMGSITITGGTITSTGGADGGAGIGGALGAPVGDISITGGTISACAPCRAAAVGAGIQGACGDILISGTARIVKALGGSTGADIGACLFGGCGRVLISGAADIGSARLWIQSGVPLRMGEVSVLLPQFRLSSRVLQLNGIRAEAPEAARLTVDAGQRWVAQIQAAYSALYRQLEESLNGLQSFYRNVSGAESPVRDTDQAGTLLHDMRQSILLQPAQAIQTHSRRGTISVRQLLR